MTWLTEKKAINEVGFCNEFLQAYSLKCIGGKFYDIDGDVSDSIISVRIAQMLTEYVTTGISRKVKALLEALKLQCHSEPLPVKDNEIHLLNGILKTDGSWLSEKQFCVNRLNIEYNPKIWDGVYCPDKFMLFLMDMLDMDDITTLQEYLGYCLIPSTKAQAMMFIIGNGGEGKSQIGIVLQEIFKSAMLTGSFQRIETDKFFRYNLKDKLLMLDDDMQLTALQTTGYIKNLVTSEIPVDVEAKGQQSEQALMYPRFLCFGNGSPKALYDKSDGFSRRLLILTTKSIPKDRVRNACIAKTFIAEKEKIFCWMFDGLRRLIRNNFQFTVSEKTKKNVSEVMADNCNIIEFLNDESFIIFGAEYQSSSADLYGGYALWCGRNALTPLKKDTFVSWLHSNEEKYSIKYDTNIINRNNQRVRGFKGIRTSYVPIVV